MNYIRTEDNVYKVSNYIEENGKIVGVQSVKCIDNNDKTTTISVKNFFKEEILNQADTIEKLCDGFVFKDTCANKLHLVDQNDGISMLGVALFEETLRGFIETDKGLIYVAKFNEKGKLELI